jgi:hypothetical protein
VKIQPKDWAEFQHYKDRNPTWIKLHRTLLDNFEFHRLPLASRALAPMLWLLASEDKEGVIDADPESLAFRLRCSIKEVETALSPLIGKPREEKRRERDRDRNYIVGQARPCSP